MHVVKAQLLHRRPCFPSWKHLRQLVVLEPASQQASCRLRRWFEQLPIGSLCHNPLCFLLLDQVSNILVCLFLWTTKRGHLGAFFWLIRLSICFDCLKMAHTHFGVCPTWDSSNLVYQKGFRWSTNSSAHGKYGRNAFLLPSKKWIGGIASRSFM